MNAEGMNQETAHLVELLERVSRQLEALPRQVAREVADAVHGQSRSRAGIAASDGLREMVAALHAERGESVFAVRDLRGAGPALQSVIERAVGPLPEGGRRLGKYFSRVRGVAAGEFTITRSVDAREGALWCLRRVCDDGAGINPAPVVGSPSDSVPNGEA